MTPEQYERWKDFAGRMARTCYRRRRNPTTAWIVDAVEDVFSQVDPLDIGCFRTWCESDPYPPGHERYSRTYRRPCWHCMGVKQPDCRYPVSCEDGHIYDYATPPFLCDLLTQWGWSYVDDDIHNLISVRDSDRLWSLRDRDQDAADALRERLCERFTGPVRCCVRSGFDMAVSRECGVTGFTAGDLRRMYPEGVPPWVTNGEWETVDITGVVPGVGFVPGTPHSPKTFSQLPDNAVVSL